MNKTDLFRQIGWSEELINHFTIIDDVEEMESLLTEDHFETYESVTTTVRFLAPSDGINVSVSIP